MLTIHQQIAADAAAAKSEASHAGPMPCTKSPALQSLIDSATDAVSESLPTSFQHCGKTYRLMIDIQRARLAIFENMFAEKSMLVALICMADEHGGNLRGGRNGQATS